MFSAEGGGRSGSGGGEGGRGSGARGGGAFGVCYEFERTNKCRFGSSCKYRHVASSNGSSHGSRGETASMTSSWSSSRNSGDNGHGGGNGGWRNGDGSGRNRTLGRGANRNNGGGNRYSEGGSRHGGGRNFTDTVVVGAVTTDETERHIKHLGQVPPSNLGEQIHKSHELWMRCWRDHATLDPKWLRVMIEVLANIPGSASVGPPPISHCQDAMVLMTTRETSIRFSHPDEIRKTAELIYNVVGRLLEFEWDCDADEVKEALSAILLSAENNLNKTIRDHFDVSLQLMNKKAELEKSWRIKVKQRQDLADSTDDATTEASTYKNWQWATIKWLANPTLFSPTCLPEFKVPSTKCNGVYNSSEEYMETIHQVWVGMTFADGHGALAPACRAGGPSGTTCQRNLWPVTSNSQLCCRSEHCQEIVAFACRTKHHDALCKRCFKRACLRHLGVPGHGASTHIYDAIVSRTTPEGILYLTGVKSRNPPIRPVHWRTSKRLQTPNLVGLVKLRSSGAALAPNDSIQWGEIAFHDDARYEGNRRERGDLAVNLSTISVEIDHDDFEDGTSIAVIDCMTFVPEWIPVLLALEKQRKSVLPFENGRLLNLWADQPCVASNSILTDSSPQEIFKKDVVELMNRMIDQSELEPIREIRRESDLRSELLDKLCRLAKESTLDNMQLVSFIDALLNPVHLTQGPPGTGKSYLGVVLVRALIAIRDLWVRKSKANRTPPILVLSYKNHAIDEFLIDLVRAEGADKLRNRLLRLGGQCKEPKLADFSERTAFQKDKEIGLSRRRFDLVYTLQQSIRSTIDDSTSFLSYRHDMFDNLRDSSADAQQARAAAANKAAHILMASLVTRDFLKNALMNIEQMKEDHTDLIESVTLALSFLALDSNRQRSVVVENRVKQHDAASLVSGIVTDVEHYALEHWGDVILMWISGKIPLPRCSFASKDGTRCHLFGTSPELPLCAKHRCHFRDVDVFCNAQCWTDKVDFCANHICVVAGCTKARFGSKQNYCKRHGCKRCFEIGNVSGPATDDPPRNTCVEHPICGSPGCYEFTNSEYCERHQVLKCSALTTQGKPCKGNPISRTVPYCRDHVEQMQDEPSDDEESSGNSDESVDDSKSKLESVDGTCQALTSKRKACKSTPLPGNRYCRVHLPMKTENGQTMKVDVIAVSSSQNGHSNIWLDCNSAGESPNDQEGHEQELTMQLGIDSSAIPMQVADQDEASSVSSAGVEDNFIFGRDLDPDEVEFDFEEAEAVQHMRDVHEVKDRKDDILPDDESTIGSQSGLVSKNAVQPVSDPCCWTWCSTLEERWILCQEHMEFQRSQLEKASIFVRKALQRARKELKEAQIRAKARLYENRSVLGGTMVGCVSRLDSIRSVRPFAVVVEEASEVLEPLLFSCLCDSTMKLEMIGDHRQLQPSIMSRFDYEVLNHVNVSMFQRLIEAPRSHSVPSDVLSIQRRMRRNICDMTRNYYHDIVAIEDHECCGQKRVGDKEASSTNLVTKCSTRGREIPGVGPHIFLWTHQGKQDRAQVGLSRINDHEAKMACSLANYLVLCGVPRPSITILTPYKGQLMLMRKVLTSQQYTGAQLLSRDSNETNVCRLSTVDRFQGDESDIVIVSMVVDEKSKTAFVQLKNRLIVLLSRARLGMYLLANVGYFYGNTNSLPMHWATTFEMLEKSSSVDSPEMTESEIYCGTRVGRELPLCCPVHRNISYCVADASELKLGFCKVSCDETLPCGHHCSSPCHWPRLRHNKACMAELFPPCPVHEEQVPCHVVYKNSPDAPDGLNHTEVLLFFLCPKEVHLMMPCGHSVTLPCWTAREIRSGKRLWPACREPSATPFMYPGCKHRVNGVCYDVEKWTKDPSSAPICRKKAVYLPPFCQHTIEVECSKREAYLVDPEVFQCQLKAKFELPRCGHTHELSCWTIRGLSKWSGQSCDEIGKVYENVDYGPKDYPCKVRVKVARVCGHEIQLSCENAFDRTYLSDPCCELVQSENRICGHVCKMACEVARALRSFPVPEPLDKLVEGFVPPYDLSLSRVQNNCKVMVTLERRCGHVIQLECCKARRPLKPCDELIPSTSPLCFHQLDIPCYFKQSFESSLWPADMVPPDIANFEIPWSAVLNRDLDCLNENLKNVLRSCKQCSVFVQECGHRLSVPCSDILDILSRTGSRRTCNEIVSLILPCGHSVEIPCCQSTLQVECAAMIRRECWNFEACGRILEAPCTYQGPVACQQDCKWRCPHGKHSYDIDLCKSGVPQSCPGCCMDTLDELIHSPGALNQKQEFYDNVLSVLPKDSVEKFTPPPDQYFKWEQKRMRLYRDYISSVPLMNRQIFKLHRVPVFRNLVDKELRKLDSFDPSLLSKQRTLFGILVKELISPNLRELASSLKAGETVVLLVGLASVLRTYREANGLPRPRKNKSPEKKMNSYLQRLQRDGYDSIVFAENGFRNLIVWDPFPFIALARLRLSNTELVTLADNLEGQNEKDLFPKYIKRELPVKKIRVSPPFVVENTKPVDDESGMDGVTADQSDLDNCWSTL